MDFTILNYQAATDMDQIEKNVAADAVEQYNIAKRQGEPTQVCVQAGLVAAAYLEAKNETRYREWKETEHHDCLTAGFPQ